MTEHPAVAYLRNAHEHAEEVARAAMKPGDFYPSDPIEWVIASNDLSTRETAAADAHIRLHAPAAVLARVEAERAIVAWHRPVEKVGYDDYGVAVIQVCGDCSGRAPCETLRLLAAVWGWTEET